jgi:hypothetical protein
LQQATLTSFLTSTWSFLASFAPSIWKSFKVWMLPYACTVFSRGFILLCW